MCCGSHSHVPLECGLPSKAQVYPPKLCQTIVKGLRLSLERELDRADFNAPVLQEADGNDEEIEEDGDGGPEVDEVVEATPRQKEMIEQLHINMGNPTFQLRRLCRAETAGKETEGCHAKDVSIQSDCCCGYFLYKTQ